METKYLEEGWKKLREPKNIVLSMILSIPLMLFLGIITVIIIKTFSTFTMKDLGFTNEGFMLSINIPIILSFFVLIYIHEILHLLLVPNFMKSNKTFLGITWFGGFAYTEEEISRNRFLVISMLPFFIISIIFPFLLNLFGMLTTSIKVISILNALSSCVDLLNFIIVVFQVPKGSNMVMSGQATYYK
ncbi:DUF3267 domain-containing protein [Hathewaya histolytica]|uniref:DUF3267 domain-containing protein n=1 Tax=Hathewaya histolytica TaxID=1498 RepID=UPI003B677D2A